MTLALNEFSYAAQPLFDQDTSSAQSHTHTVPSGEVWIVKQIIARQASQQSTAYWQVSNDGGTTYSGAVHFGTDRNTGAAVSEYIEFVEIKLMPGDILKITFETFTAGDTVNTTILGYKFHQ